MAARRLIVVMLVLLGISTAIAILAPDPAEQGGESGATGSTSATGTNSTGSTGTTSQTGEPEPAQSSGSTGAKGSAGKTGSTGGSDAPAEDGGPNPGTIEVTITVTRTGKPGTVCARPGSRLVLTLKTVAPLDISIPAFGRTGSATEYAPAIFDLLMPQQPGRYGIQTLEAGQVLGTIVSNGTCSRPAGQDSA
jgi:hypothetical protein